MPSPKTDLVDLPDVNLLLALVQAAHVHHAQARDWFSNTTRYLTTPVTEAGFLRLAINQRVMGVAVSFQEALASLFSITHDSRAKFLPDDASFASPQIALDGLVGHRQVTDMHLVDLASRHQAQLVTFDTRITATLVGADRAHVNVIG